MRESEARSWRAMTRPFQARPALPSIRVMLLDPTIERELKTAIDKYAANGTLRAKGDLDRYYATFRARFGPDALRGLEGPTLLDTLHYTGNTSSLVYWLEFKNDDELPAIFGSIAGGSALKFGLYRRRDTGVWMTGHSSAQRELSLDEAIAMATRNRDQLVAGAAVLDALSADPGRVDHNALQASMMRVAPDVADTAWGHKYFSLIAPTLIDPYHAPHYQLFYLLKMLMASPNLAGRYASAAGFVGAARELGVPIMNLATTLSALHGTPHSYWRVGTGNDEAPRGQWPTMRSKARAAIGWRELGDLSSLEHTRDARDALRKRIETELSVPAARAGIVANYLFRIVHDVVPGDLVIAADGETNLAIGRVTGDYSFDGGEGFPHGRPVEWLDVADWKFPTSEGLRTTLVELKKAENLVAIERRLSTLRARGAPVREPSTATRAPLSPLSPMLERIHGVLERKGQVILYGPPGTGKTHHAEAAARELAARAWFTSEFAQLSNDDRLSIVGGPNRLGAVEVCCFHPAYGYEDFLEGYRPRSSDGALGFELRDGVFKRLCRRAEATPTKPWYLVIDEINRGDIPRIFGELMLVLERGRRGTPVVLPVSGERLVVPPNVFVLGTMNTADRSIALLDTALRRRFGFIELMPDATVLRDAVVAGIPLGPWLDALNERIVRHAGRDARNLQVGHSYLLHNQRPISDLTHLAQVLRDDVIPLLEEYCYEDYAALERILGSTLVRRDRQRIDHTLFAPARADELVRALLEPCPDITASPQAIAGEMQQAQNVAEDEGDAAT